MTLKKRQGLKYFLLVIPFMIFTFMFAYVPLFGWSYSLFDYNVARGIQGSKFVGLANFAKILTDTRLPRTLRNTLVQSGLGFIFSPFSMFVAIGMNEIRNSKVRRTVQTITTLPNFISWITVFGFAFVLLSTNGLLSEVMRSLGLKPPEFGILGDVHIVWGVQQALGMWKGGGWGAIIYLAAISGIDTELYDAAEVDGANRLQLIRYITIPSILPTYLVQLLLNVGNILNTGFDQYFMFWNSLVAERIENLDYYIYATAFKTFNGYSYSIALGIVKSLIGVVLLFIVNYLSKRIRGSRLI